MTHPAVKSFLGAGAVVLATVLAPLAVQSQSTNTTLQNGRINLNQTCLSVNGIIVTVGCKGSQLSGRIR